LGLANTAVGMAMNDAKGNYSLTYLMVALVTLAITVACSIFFKNIISLIPVLMGIIGGYIFAYTQGLVDFSKVVKAEWI
ncbi:uracil permease, partial [Escherichia coli]|nr:uracil permease [Escherichia coli]